jgi:hypothetical protein
MDNHREEGWIPRADNRPLWQNFNGGRRYPKAGPDAGPCRVWR